MSQKSLVTQGLSFFAERKQSAIPLSES